MRLPLLESLCLAQVGHDIPEEEDICLKAWFLQYLHGQESLQCHRMLGLDPSTSDLELWTCATFFTG